MINFDGYRITETHHEKTSETPVLNTAETLTLTTAKSLDVLDLTAVMKASQAISGEIQIEQLLSTLMQVVIESAGAQKGALILLETDQLVVVAQCASTQACNVHFTSIESCPELPLTVINYVSHARETVVIQDASVDTLFAADPYIIHHSPKSISCTPLIKQGKLIGILYLENNLITGAFTSDRIEVLKLLASQAAISLENARLYEQLEEYSRTLEAKVQQRTQQLQQEIRVRQQAEEKFSKAFQSSPNPIAITDFADGRYIEVNDSFCQVSGYAREELIGHTTTELNNWVNLEERNRFRQILQEQGEIRDREIQIYTKSGDVRLWLVSSELISLDDTPCLLSVVDDITDAYRQATQRKRAEEELCYRNQILSHQNQVLTELTRDPTLYDGDLHSSVRKLTEITARTLSSERASIWLFDETKTRCICLNLFERSSGQHCVETDLLVADYPTYFQALETAKVIAADNAHTDWRTREFSESYLTPLGIASMLEIPIRRGDELIGVMCTEHVGETRIWTVEEQSFARSIGNLISLAIEVCHRQQAEESLRQSEERWQLAIAGNNDGIWDLNIVTNETFRSARWYEILGYVEGELSSSNDEWSDRIHPDDFEPVMATDRDYLTRKIPTYAVEYRLRCKDGTYKWVSSRAQALWDEQGNPIRMVGSTRDITERKQREEALRQSEEKFRQLAESIQEVFFLRSVDDYQMLYVSPAYEKIWGLSCQSLYDNPMSCLESIHPDDRDRVHAAFTGHLKSGQGDCNIEYRIIRPDGTVRWIRSQASLVLNQAGQPYRIAGIAEDITERKQREDAIQLIVQGTASAIGSDFFHSLVQHLAQILQVRYAVVAECTDSHNSQANSLALWIGEDLGEDLDGNLTGTPCQTTVRRSNSYYSSGLQTLFPDDPLLADLNIQSYWGTTLRDASGNPIGTLAVLDTKPIPHNPLTESILKIFAARAGVEIERKQAEEKLRATTARLKEAQRVAHLGGWEYDVNTKKNAWTEELFHIFGLDPSQPEPTYAQLVALVHPDERSQFQQIVEQAITTGIFREFETQIIRPNGSLRHLACRGEVVCNPQGEVIKLIGTALDITERKQAETERDRFFNLSKDMLCIASTDGYFRQVNPAFETILGWTVEELTARPLIEFVHPDDWAATLSETQKNATGIETTGFENRYRCKDGSYKWLSWRSTSLPDRRLIYAVARDITDRKQVEENLQRAKEAADKANKAKSEFLANMSHELRTPLTAILGLAEILQDGVYGELNAKQQRSVATITQSGQHLRDLINDILDLAKVEAGKMDLHLAPTSIKELCQSSLAFVKPQATKKQISLSFDVSPELKIINVDERRMRQVLINLLGNAVKFTPANGHVSLEVQADPMNEVLRFSAIDTGIGIAPEDIHKLFQPFVQVDSSFSRRYAGTGLGLALVQRIIEMHGGGVSVESEVGKGSRFTVSLPWMLVENKGSNREKPIRLNRPNSQCPVPNSSPSMSYLVLLVEDNEENSFVIKDYLEVQGYRVAIARNGLEAVQMTKMQRPDVVLMDIQLPEMDGIEAARRIRCEARFAQIPIIALTSLVMPGQQEKCLAAGMSEYLAKPVSMKNLVHAIARYLHSHIEPTGI
jgi:PAS domain S-box-containing protein